MCAMCVLGLYHTHRWRRWRGAWRRSGRAGRPCALHSFVCVVDGTDGVMSACIEMTLTMANLCPKRHDRLGSRVPRRARTQVKPTRRTNKGRTERALSTFFFTSVLREAVPRTQHQHTIQPNPTDRHRAKGISTRLPKYWERQSPMAHITPEDQDLVSKGRRCLFACLCAVVQKRSWLGGNRLYVHVQRCKRIDKWLVTWVGWIGQEPRESRRGRDWTNDST